MTKRFTLELVDPLVVVVLVLAACGSDGNAPESSGSDRTIKVEMRDNSFSPTTVSAKAGETVRFEFTNVGEVDHEAIIGDEETQTEHSQEMMSPTSADDMGDGEHGGEHGSLSKSEAITVKPGKEGELIHTFEAGQDLLIGCHEPGHYAAGMKMRVSAA